MAFLEPGTYAIRATYHAVLRVENELTVDDVDAVDEAINGSNAELVDWDVKKIG